MKHWHVVVTVVVLAGLLAVPAFGADIELARKSTLNQIVARGTLRVGFEAGYAPFEMTNKKGEFIGFDIDMAKLMAEALGTPEKAVKLELVNTAWDGIISSLTTGKFDIIMSGMTVTQERNLKVNFADPFITIGQTILLAKKHEGKVKSYKDLNSSQYTVTSKLGTTGEKATQRMMPKAKYKSFETEIDGVLDVINGKSDAFVYDLPYCVVALAQQGSGKLVFLDKPFTYEPLAWAVNQGDPDFLNWLNNFLRQVQNDGRYDQIYNKWIKSTEWAKDAQL